MSLFEKFKLYKSKSFWRKRVEPDVFGTALLSDDQVHELGKLIFRHRPATIPEFRSDFPAIGPAPSLQRGQGLDVLENRAYFITDDPKHINWRMSARLNELHTKVLIEEKQTRALIVVDRRPPMRFGTRSRLKVTQAAIAAITLLYDLVHQGISTEVVLVEDRIQALPTTHTVTAAFATARLIAAPCRPGFSVSGHHDKNKSAKTRSSPDIIAVLQFLDSRYNAGYSIYCISDFHDLEQQHRNLLLGIHQNNVLGAIHVVDPVEVDLPQTGVIDILAGDDHGMNDSKPHRIDTNNIVLRDRYRNRQRTRLDEVHHCISNTGNHYYCLMSDTNLFDKPELDAFTGAIRYGG